MSALAKAARSPVIPTLRYRNLDRAVQWLHDALGFSLQDSLQGADGRLISAQLAFGSGLVMVAAVGHSAFDDVMKQPDEIGGAETQSCYFIVADCDTHYAAAVAHGATIVLELQTFETGGRGYMCRDLEGHLWSFGTYDPWSSLSGRPGLGTLARTMWSHPAVAQTRARAASLEPKRKLALVAAAVACVVAAGTAASMTWSPAPSDVPGSTPHVSAIQLFKERGAKFAAEGRAGRSEAELADAHRERDKLELDVAKLQEELAHVGASQEQARAARLTLELQAARANQDLLRVREAKEQAERFSRVSIAKSLRDRQARQRVRRQLEDLRQQLVAERDGRQRAEKSAKELKVDFDRESAAADAAVTDRVKTQELLFKEQEARTKVEASLRQAQEELRNRQAAAVEDTEAGDAAAPPPPRPAKRPAKRKN